MIEFLDLFNFYFYDALSFVGKVFPFALTLSFLITFAFTLVRIIKDKRE